MRAFYTGALTILGLDFLSKQVIRATIPSPTTQPLTTFLSITNINNTGSLFGLLNAHNVNWLFATLTLTIIGIIIWILCHKQLTTLELFSWGIITGGGIGNLIDRLWQGAVTDFIDLHYWPVFNIADTGITTGIILLLINELFLSKK